MKRRNRRRWIAFALTGLVMVAAITVLFFPSVLTTGLGRGLFAAWVERSVGGSVVVDELDVSWGGPQSARGLAVDSVDGRPIARLDVVLDAGLVELLLARVDRWTATVGGTVEIEIDEDGGSPLATLLANLDSGPPSPRVVPIDVRLEGLRVRAQGGPFDESFDLGGRVDRAASGGIDVAITGLVDTAPFTLAGQLEPDRDMMTGRLTGTDVPTALLQPWLDDTHVIAPRDLGPTIDFEILSEAGTARTLTLTATSEHLQAMVHGVVGEDGALHGDRLEARGTLQPALIREIDTLRPQGPLRYTIESSSFTVPRSDGAYRIVESAAAGTLRFEDPLPVLLGNELVLTDVTLGLRSERLGDAVHIDGTAQTDDASSSVTATVSELFDDAGTLNLGQARAVGRLETRSLATTTVARVLGDEDDWVGTLFGSSVDATLTSTEAGRALSLALDLSGGANLLTARGVLEQGTLTVSEMSTDVELTPALLGRLGVLDGDLMALAAPARARVTIEPFDVMRWSEPDRSVPERFEFKASCPELSITPVSGNAEPTTLRAFRLSGHLDQREQRLRFDADADVVSASGETVAHAVMDDLVIDFGTTTPHHVEGRLGSISTLFVEDIAGIDGPLAAALGPRIDMTFASQDFTTSRGRLEVRVDSPVGWIEGRVEGRGGLIVTPPDTPLRAELDATRTMCKDLIGVIHPALGDICSTQERVRITVSNASFPTDGDLRKLNANVKIEIGDAQFHAGGGLFAPLDLAAGLVQGDGECAQTVSGTVEPIEARIAGGIVTYESFVIRMGKHRLRYTGTVDLAARTLDIQTEVPLDALGAIGRSIPLLPTGITVPVHSTGPFDDVTTTVEVDRLIGSVPDAILGPIVDIFRK